MAEHTISIPYDGYIRLLIIFGVLAGLATCNPTVTKVSTWVGWLWLDYVLFRFVTFFACFVWRA